MTLRSTTAASGRRGGYSANKRHEGEMFGAVVNTSEQVTRMGGSPLSGPLS